MGLNGPSTLFVYRWFMMKIQINNAVHEIIYIKGPILYWEAHTLSEPKLFEDNDQIVKLVENNYPRELLKSPKNHQIYAFNLKSNNNGFTDR